MIKAASVEILYRTEFSNGKNRSIADTTFDKGGSGDGFRPHELLEAALATCMNMSMRMHAQRQGIALSSVSTTVVLDRSKADEVCFEYSVALPEDLSEADHQKLLEVAQTCSVHKTLSKKLTFRGSHPLAAEKSES